VAVCEIETVVRLSTQLRPSGLKDKDRLAGPVNPFVPLKLIVNIVEPPASNDLVWGAEMVNSGRAVTVTIMSML